MDWIERMNLAIADIEAHLTDEIDYDRLGRIACCSAYHFQRLFAYMAGVPLSEYVRRRRMSLAAVDLQGGESVLDVALKYGYQSPTAFNRAFRSVHGLAPSAVRGGVSVKSFPPLTLKIIVKGVEELNYRIETKAPFRIVGVSVPLANDMEANFQNVPGKWDEVASDGTLERLVSLMAPSEGAPTGDAPVGILGVCRCEDGTPWRYYIAVASTREAEGLEELTVPAATWAIFPGEGTFRSIQELERRVLTEWLPTSGYEYADAPDVEVYMTPDPANARFEVWIPVVKKN